MIPHPASALTMLSGRLMAQLLPDLKSNYSMSDGMLIGLLMNALADELESGIDTRMQDIDDMQQIFRTARDSVKSDVLPSDLESVLESQPARLTLEAVNELHDSLTRVLIELHELVDHTSADDAARSLNEEIWTYLDRQAQRHRITAAG